jgi:predicted cobalt transporter CbtA
MSEPAAPPPRQAVDRHYSAGLITLMVVGCILLLPGICSIAFILGMAPELNSKSFGDPIAQMIFALWGICFAASAIGIALIVVARRRARLN